MTLQPTTLIFTINYKKNPITVFCLAPLFEESTLTPSSDQTGQPNPVPSTSLDSPVH